MVTKHTYYTLFIFLILFLSPVHGWASTVTVETIHSVDSYEQNKTYPLLFRLKIEKDWFIHGAVKEEEYLIPTVLSFKESTDLNLSAINFPVPEKRKFEYTSKPVEVYSNHIMVQATLSIGQKATVGDHLIKGNLSYQACSSTACLPPEDVPIEILVTVIKAGSITKQINNEIFLSAKKDTRADMNGLFDRGMFWALFLIFMGGLALNLTPCIYPLIPITVSYFAGRDQKSWGETILLSILYLCGLAVTNSILGVAAALSGGMMGFALQYPPVLIIIACIMVLLGFSFFGFWELRLPSALTRAASKSYKGYFGTFFMGLTLGIVAAPCIGPFVLMLLTYVGQKGDPFLGFLYFFILSLGMGLPLCILAIFSGAIERLPMSGDWMLWIRKFMGWVLIGMGYYFTNSLIPNHLHRHAVLFVVALIAGIHLGWIDRSGKGLRLFYYVKKATGIIIILFGLYFLVSAIDLDEKVQWTPYNETILNNAARDRKPVILDVYADWCIPCREMEKKIFRNPEVVKLSKDFIKLQLDITRKQPEQDIIRKRFHIEGAPTIIFFNKDGQELTELRVESMIDHTEFLTKMEKTLGN